MTTYVISCIMPIHGHCTLMYPGLLDVLVAVCVGDLPDWWHPLYATSLIMPVFMRFQLSWLVPVYVRHFQPLWRSWSIIYLQYSRRSWSFVYLHHGYSDLSILYVAMTTHEIFCIMPIHGHCTLMYLGLLNVFAVICRVVLLYYADWMAGLPFGILHHSTSRMDL